MLFGQGAVPPYVVCRKRLDLLPTLTAIDLDIAVPGVHTVPIGDRRPGPILGAAVAGAVDVVVSGNKVFPAMVGRPRILTPGVFLDAVPSW